jgi:hypothetical protein
LFADLDSLDKSGIHKEDEKGNENESRFIIDSIPYPVDKSASTSGGTKPNEERNLQVYTRRRSRTKKMSQLEEQQATHEITEVEVRSSDSPNLVQVSSNTNEEGLEIGGEEDNQAITFRRERRSRAGIPPPRYGFEESNIGNDENDIANYVSYESVCPAYKNFIESLETVRVPKDWREAKQHPKWKMLC